MRRHHVAVLLIAWFPSGAALGQVGNPPVLQAEFDWSMPDRYGLDQNGDGRPDVPNSLAYVNNIGTEQCPSSTADAPTFALVLDASGSKATSLKKGPGDISIALPVPISRYTWSVTSRGAPTGPIVFESTAAVTTRCLPEGLHSVTLTISIRLGDSKSVTKEIPVEDILIVSVGDSYASGEGDPEHSHRATSQQGQKRVTTVYWADAGTSPPSGFNRIEEALQTTDMVANIGQTGFDNTGGTGRQPGQTGFDNTGGTGQQPGQTGFDNTGGTGQQPGQTGFDNTGGTGRQPGQTEFGKTTRWVETAYTSHATTEEGWEHVMAHRSTLAGPAQAALALERSDKRTSVTFVFLAASGATVGRGVTASYNGVGNEPSTKGRSPLKPQLRQVRSLIRNRRVDALWISVGGNDIGFSNIATAMVIRNNKDGLDDVEASVKDGDWTRMERGKNTGSLQWLDTNVGLSYLGDEYRKLAYALKEELPDVFNIYLIEYPDPTRGSNGKYCNRVLDQAVHRDWKTNLGEGLLNLVSLEVTNEELEWADEEILQLLNTRIGQAADANDWVPVATYAASKNHGLCAASPYRVNVANVVKDEHAEIADYGPNIYPGNPFPEELGPGRDGIRWFRRAKEASRLQGPTNTEETKGTLHPNEYGHRFVKDRLLASLYLPVDIAGIGQRDPDDALHEATVLRSDRFWIIRPLPEGAPWSSAPQVWPRSDVDMYRVHASAKERLTLTVVADLRDDYPWSGPDLNAALRVFDDKGVELVPSDAPQCSMVAAEPVSASPDIEVDADALDWEVITKQMQAIRTVTSGWGFRHLTSKSFSISSAGKYYAGVSAEGNRVYEPASGMGDQSGEGAGRYTMLLFSAPLDDTMPCATAIALPTELREHANETLDDIDMFSFEVTERSRLAVTLALGQIPGPALGVFNEALKPHMNLFNADGRAVGKGSNSLDEELVPGAYYLGISADERAKYDPRTGRATGGSRAGDSERRQKPGFGWYKLAIKLSREGD